MISENGGRQPKWRLFDLSKDYGQRNDVIRQHPEIAEQLGIAFDQWWADCLPMLENEKVVGPKLNPFAELYWKQFGGGPDSPSKR